MMARSRALEIACVPLEQHKQWAQLMIPRDISHKKNRLLSGSSVSGCSIAAILPRDSNDSNQIPYKHRGAVLEASYRYIILVLGALHI